MEQDIQNVCYITSEVPSNSEQILGTSAISESS